MVFDEALVYADMITDVVMVVLVELFEVDVSLECGISLEEVSSTSPLE